LLALVPAVVDALTPLPVIAAGGIANGRAAAAALALELRFFSDKPGSVIKSIPVSFFHD